MKYLIVSFPLSRSSSSDCFGSQLHQRWFCTRVWNGWHFTWETRCKNANPQEGEVYLSLSVTHCVPRSESLLEQLNRRWILKLDPPSPTATHHPSPLWTLVLASGATGKGSHLRGSPLSCHRISSCLLAAAFVHQPCWARNSWTWRLWDTYTAAEPGKNVNCGGWGPKCDTTTLRAIITCTQKSQVSLPGTWHQEVFDFCPKPAFMKNQNWQRRQEMSKLVKRAWSPSRLLKLLEQGS